MTKSYLANYGRGKKDYVEYGIGEHEPKLHNYSEGNKN
jgi:hypothetical protein